MKRLFHSFPARSLLGCAAMLCMSPLPAVAQGVFVAPPTPNADQLAIEMRALAANPGDVRALLSAGDLSVRLHDAAAAMQFYARAEKVDPNNPRIPAGRGAALVRLGRPGEALRLFAEAERRGYPGAQLAAHRAFAYDLIGQPRHAQVEYRRALDAHPGDRDLMRAYALSQGIGGDRAAALRTLDPLLRERDRAAWRMQAFVLAMDGDVAGAQSIANTMMPGFGASFTPLFRQLASLRDPADRAFAVHRGEVGRTPQRMADATMAPALPAFQQAAPIRVAAVVEQPAERARPARRGRERAERVGRRSRGKRTPIADTPAVAVAARSAPAPAPVAQPIPRILVASAAVPPPMIAAPAAPARVVAAPVAVAAATADIDPASVVPVAVASGGEARLRAAATRPVDPIVSRPMVTGRVAPAPLAASGAVAIPAATVAAGAAPATVSSAPSALAPVKAAIGREDDVLASILKGIAVPAAELGVVEAAPPVSTPVAPGNAASIVASSKPEPPKPAAIAVEVAAKSEAAPSKPAKTEVAAEAAARKEVAAKAEAPAKAKAPTKAKKAPAKPTDPARHWVQVAGGANKDDLPKEWKRLSGLAPDALKGKTAWTTPLRFTNRLLAGPFDSTDDAQTFVNAMGKKGISTFAWTSEAGQKIEKLPSK